MPKAVRYYITESDDHTVVRAMPVAMRQEPEITQRHSTPDNDGPLDTPDRSRRDRLRSRLRTHRQTRDDA